MLDEIQRALTAVELRENELLAWGAVGAEWRKDELLEFLEQHGDADDLLSKMLDLAAIVETPSGGYRTRSAETVRLLATLRQAFRSEAILHGRSLVLDYRFLQRPRRRPRRDVPAERLVDALEGRLGVAGRRVLATLAPPLVSTFQLESTQGVIDALVSPDPSGVVVTAGTGSGKTLSFYMPLLGWLCEQPPTTRSGPVALALYPRIELLKDQLRTLVGYALRIRNAHPELPRVSLATWFGPTPWSAESVRLGQERDWRKATGGRICPYLRCPAGNCDGDMIWPEADLRAGIELLRCAVCQSEVPGEILRLTRRSALRTPAKVMLSTTESLNRQLASPANLRAFGVNPATLKAVLLDEVHTYEGTTGAQNAYLFRRLKNALRGASPMWAGLSATLANAGEFFADLVDLEVGKVRVIQPRLVDLEEAGAEYLVALRHDPNGSTGVLSTTIQTAMLMARTLDPMRHNPFNPGVDSRGLFGSRLFAFTDKLDSTNRLYWDLLDAEGWAYPGAVKGNTRPLTLAHLRSAGQDRVNERMRESFAARDDEGQSWWLGELLGHAVDGDVQKQVGRTSSQDSGVARDAEIVVATASLEVGFDDDRVGAVIQHKAPHDVAQFLQRKGRAGRNMSTRPWTVVVLGNWGRDRDAWESYDSLFDPVVPPRALPMENMYVLRIQAVYSLLDWLASEVHGDAGSSWSDSAGPPSLLFPTNVDKQNGLRGRQRKMAALLGELLRNGAERAALIRHLRRSLSLGNGAVAEATIDKLLWEAPRPLLAAVVPTLRRRLEDEWAGERPLADDRALVNRTPLRDFVPGNLFDELLVPDVEFVIPWVGNDTQTEQLPALRALTEFLPGNVSRHFGVWASNKRHWLPLPNQTDSDGVGAVDVSEFGGARLDTLETAEGPVHVFVPTSVQLRSVPDEVSDASSMRADWEFNAMPLGTGTALPIAREVRAVLASLRAHLHSQGGGARIVRYATSARGTLWINGQALEQRIRFVDSGANEPSTAGIGVEIHADAIYGRVVLPQFLDTPAPAERAQWLHESIERSSSLPSAIPSLERIALGEVVDVAATNWDWESAGDPSEVDFHALLVDACTRLGISGANAIGGWIANPEVVSALRQCVLRARTPERSDGWIDWLSRRFTVAVAEVVLSALAAGNRRVDTDELLIDIDPSEPGAFYVSERSPGGSGQIEALAIDLIEHSDRFGLAFADALRPTDIELLDGQMRSVLESSNDAVIQSIRLLQASWQHGHEKVRVAKEHLEATLRSAGISLDRTARIAISTRIAGPGSSDGFIEEIREWLSVRDDAERVSGFFVSPRTLGALLAARTAVDRHLHLSAPSDAVRGRAIANVLWPRNGGYDGQESFNPYAGGLKGAVELVRLQWRQTVKVLDFVEWSEVERSKTHQILKEEAELILRVEDRHRLQLRKAVLDIQTIPVEVGPIWCYPEILGVHSDGGLNEVRLLLKEIW